MRRAVTLALLVTACVTLAGCGSTSRSDGNVVEIFGPYRGVEADRFSEVIEPFVSRTGIRVRYVGSVDFVEDLRLRAGEENDPPDIAVVPQPGLIRQLATDGALVPVGEAVAREVDANYSPAIAAFGRIDGTLYAFPFRLSIKSLVWYRPSVFALHGWTPPRTHAELRRLTARITSVGEMAPWCLGISAGTATGWPATDWVEDLLLRTAGLDVYRGWVRGSIPFRDPRVAASFDAFHELVLAPGRVAGGLSAVVATSVAEAVQPMFDPKPGCAMLKQADFAAAWMPAGTTIGADGDVAFFLLPGTSAGKAPLVLGGDQIVQFRHNAPIDELMDYLAGPEAGRSWVENGGFISPKSTIPADAYPSDYLRSLVATLQRAEEVAFDGSDQMPPDIGSGLLWREITRWVTGVIDYRTLARRLDRARTLPAQANE